MKLTDNAKLLLINRYCRGNETPYDVYPRVAKAIGESVGLEKEFLQMMREKRFMPASPILMNAGPGLSNFYQPCIVLPILDNMESILETLKKTGNITKLGGGCGYNISYMRELGAPLSCGGYSSGPLSFMRIYNELIEQIKQGGVRKGALIATMWYDHPDIFQFIDSKINTNIYNNFNFSVMLNDQFMKAVKSEDEINIISRYNNKIIRNVRADELFYKIAFAAEASGDPGVQFFDRINKDNTLYPDEIIEATNPCSLTGDTLIAVADGRNVVSLKELADEGKDVPVYCYDKKNRKVTIRRGFKPRLTKHMAEIWKITLDDDSIIKVTNDHKFMRRNGEYDYVRNLKPGDSLMPFKQYEYNNYDYVNLNNGNARKVSRMIFEYNNDVDLNKKEIIHHVDKNTHNNSIDNLELMSWSEHTIHHNTGREYSEETIQKFIESGKKRFNDVGEREKISKSRKKYFVEHGIPDYMTKDRVEKLHYNCVVCGTELIMSESEYNYRIKNNKTGKVFCSGKCSNKYTKTGVTYWSDEEIIEHGLKYVNEFKKLPTVKSWREYSYGKKNIPSTEVIRKQFGGMDKFKKNLCNYNHKVKSIEFYGYDDTYDITVDETHNYAIVTKIDGRTLTGIIISNSEEAMFPYESCSLISVNLNEHITNDHNIDISKLSESIELATKFLLSSNKLCQFPYLEMKEMAEKYKRIGVGITGFADALIKMNVMYDSRETLEIIDIIGSLLKNITNKYAPDSISKRAIAPDGSRSILLGASSSIEPIYKQKYIRYLTFGEILEERPKSEYMREAHDISANWRLEINSRWQKYIDNGISTTINLPYNKNYNDIMKIYMRAWEKGLKGITVFIDQTKKSVYRECRSGQCDL